MKIKIANIFKKTGAVFVAAACLFSFFLPLPKNIAYAEEYVCSWEDGSVSAENFSSAYLSLAGMDETHVILERDGLTGKIVSWAGDVYTTLESGNLGELLQCSVSGTRLDSAALYRTFSNRVWYSGEYYVFSGRGVKRVSRATADTLVCLEGTVTQRVLKETNAKALYLRSGATVKADAFTGGNVKTVCAEEPYSVNGGAIYLDTPSGKRLLTALSGIEELTVDPSLRFADEGALIACQNLQSLTLPFLGSAKSPYGTEYTGELAHLFSSGKEYRVPQMLSFVMVTGGRVGPTAFYACPNLQVIDICKVDPSEISEDAFLGLDALEILHTPQQNVLLTSDFNAYQAHGLQCGCTVYIKADSQNQV